MKEKKKKEDTSITPPVGKKLLLPATTALLLITISIAGYFFYQYQKAQTELKTPSLKAQQEVTNIVDKVAKLIELPRNEIPTIATVSDKSKLKDQLFFANTENGDKVLIYQNAKKAILYRPSINKLIEVSTINVANQNKGQVSGVETEKQVSSTSAIKITPAPIKVVIYNGTATVGLAKVAEKQINDKKIPGVNVVETDNAVRKDFPNTLIIDLKGNNQQISEQLATIVNGQLSKDFPETEEKPDADILVIVGK
jgi:hypothetical protein